MKIKNILLVDDEVHVRRIAEISLSRIEDWHISVAGSGLEALQKARSEMPDLILLDMKMPVMDGRMTLERLREDPALAKVPVILLTASMEDKGLEKDLQVLGVIIKPYSALTLPDEIFSLTKDL